MQQASGEGGRDSWQERRLLLPYWRTIKKANEKKRNKKMKKQQQKNKEKTKV